MLTVIVLVLFTLTAALDWLPDIKNRPKRELGVYSLMFVAALTVLILYSVGVQVPGPSDAIRGPVEAIFPIK